MPETTLKVNGEAIPFNMPYAGLGASSFIFAPPKSGSTFLNHLIADLAKFGPQPNVNIPSTLFDAGINFQQAKLERANLLFETDGYCFSGFRDWPRFLGGGFQLDNYKRVFMMRDPRDMLVSNYFSMAKSHPIPESGAVKEQMEENRTWALSTDINEYVLGEPLQYYRNLLDRMVRVWQNPTKHIASGDPTKQRNERKRVMLLSVRYEDVVFKKAEFAERLCKFLEWNIDPTLVTKLAKKQDVFPDEERPEKHIRQVNPGNFRKKLDHSTVLKLNAELRSHLNLFGYEE